MQFKDSLWSVSLRTPDRVHSVFDPESVIISPRHAIRRVKDSSSIYCLIETSTKEQVVKVKIGDGYFQEQKLQVQEIFDSHASRLLVIEADPENFENIFVVDDEQRVYTLKDASEGKAQILEAQDMSQYSLEDELELVMQKSWTSLSVNQLVLTIEDYSFCRKENFFWKTEDT